MQIFINKFQHNNSFLHWLIQSTYNQGLVQERNAAIFKSFIIVLWFTPASSIVPWSQCMTQCRSHLIANNCHVSSRWPQHSAIFLHWAIKCTFNQQLIVWWPFMEAFLLSESVMKIKRHTIPNFASANQHKHPCWPTPSSVSHMTNSRAQTLKGERKTHDPNHWDIWFWGQAF